MVADVRYSPRAWSAIWNAQGIRKVCEQVGVQYASMPELGNTSGTADWVPPDPDKVVKALQELAKLTELGSVALVCAELNPKSCHRTSVANALASIVKMPVIHLP